MMMMMKAAMTSHQLIGALIRDVKPRINVNYEARNAPTNLQIHTSYTVTEYSIGLGDPDFFIFWRFVGIYQYLGHSNYACAETAISELTVKILISPLEFSDPAVLKEINRRSDDDVFRCIFHCTGRKSVVLLFPVHAT